MRNNYIRMGFAAAQSSELWDRRRKGEGLTSIGRALGKPSFGQACLAQAAKEFLEISLVFEGQFLALGRDRKIGFPLKR